MRLADLPVQLSVKYETVLNMTTAKALGFDVPTSILRSADELIEQEWQRRRSPIETKPRPRCEGRRASQRSLVPPRSSRKSSTADALVARSAL
jgi:hypothetical protein